MICPACGTDAAVLITNVVTGSQFCHHCAAAECPSFLPHFVLTLEDVRFMRDCGINPEISRIEAAIRGK
jgi:hypothetical protein